MAIDVVFRNEKGDELTWEEMDANLANIKVAVEAKKDNFTILPVDQGGTGNSTLEGLKSDLGVPEFASQIEYQAGGVGAVVNDVQTELRRRIYAANYSSLQAAVTAAGSGTLELEAGHTYSISTPVVCSTSGLTIVGNGATIDGSGMATAIAYDDVYGLRIEGSIGSAVSVTADIAEGNVVVSTTTTGLSAGDMILLYSTGEKVPEGASGSTSYKGELHRIRSIDSASQLTLMDGTFYAYTAASGANIKKVTPIENVTVSNLRVVMGGANKAHSGISVKYAANINLDNVRTTNTEDCGVRLQYTYGAKVNGGSFTNCTSPADGSSGVTAITGYGVSPATGSRNIEVCNAYFNNNRHSVAGGGTYAAIHVLVRGNYIAGGRSSALAASYQLDCHEDALYWTFDSNHISAANTTTGTGGILIRGQKTKVINNTVNNSFQYGIYAKNYDNPSSSTGLIISGNVVTKSRLDGIVIEGSSSAEWFDVEIYGNQVRNPGGEGIAIFGTTRGVVSGNIIIGVSVANKSAIRFVGTAATAGNRCKDFIVSGNVVDQSALYGIRCEYSDGFVISNNKLNSITSEVIYLSNCNEIVASGNFGHTVGATRSGVYISASTRVSVSGGVFKNTATPSGDSSGVYATGATTDLAVSGINAINFRYGVKSAAPANYISVAGINARTCTVSSVDVSASANTSVAGNL